MSLQEVLNRMLPPVQNSNGSITNPHITTGNGFGGARDHNGIDINYTGGQGLPLNQSNPCVYSPVSGTVINDPNSDPYHTVKIRDSEGNVHEFLHMDSVNVGINQPITSGDPIGTMGGYGPRGPNHYDQHVDYRIESPDGNYWLNPEVYWDGKSPDPIPNEPSNNGDGFFWPGDLGGVMGGIGVYFNGAQGVGNSFLGSPIILDLNGDGVETTGLKSGAYFDHDGNGFAEQTGWVSSDDGLLVMDRNGNGIIDNGTELFGNDTLLQNGQKAANGFQALAELDTNADGKIDANDAAYTQLRIWQDIDGDGYSAPDELFTLSELGVQSINTGYFDTNVTDANGNEHRQVGTFTKTDGTTGAAEDVWFNMDKMNTLADEWLAVPADIAALPDLQGYGNVYDLQQAMVVRLLKNAHMLRFPYHSSLRRTSKSTPHFL